MAFQLVDDVLDFTAREKTLGKPVGGDLREGKVTLAAGVCAGARHAPGAPPGGDHFAAAQLPRKCHFRRILALLEKYRGIERVKERAQSFTDKARRIINEFPDSPYQRALLAVTELVTERDH